MHLYQSRYWSSWCYLRRLASPAAAARRPAFGHPPRCSQASARSALRLWAHARRGGLSAAFRGERRQQRGRGGCGSPRRTCCSPPGGAERPARPAPCGVRLTPAPPPRLPHPHRSAWPLARHQPTCPTTPACHILGSRAPAVEVAAPFPCRLLRAAPARASSQSKQCLV